MKEKEEERRVVCGTYIGPTHSDGEPLRAFSDGKKPAAAHMPCVYHHWW